MKLFNFTTYGLLRRRILNVSNGIDEPGEIRLPLATTLFISWIAVFFCIHKGIKSSGKVNQESTVLKINLNFTCYNLHFLCTFSKVTWQVNCNKKERI